MTAGWQEPSEGPVSLEELTQLVETPVPTGVLRAEQAMGARRLQHMGNFKTLALSVAVGVVVITLSVVLIMSSTAILGPPVVDFAVDSKVIVDGSGGFWDHLVFEGGPKIHVGDPAPPGLLEVYRRHGQFKYLDGCWRRSKEGFKLLVTYAFDNGTLEDVKINSNESLSSDWFESAVQICESKFGAHHYVEHPTFTLKNGSLIQNEVFGWRTTAGNWELSKFNPHLGGVSERTGVPVPNYLHVGARLVKPKP